MDIKKAYDNASWDFLVQVMGRMGFGAKWIGLIHWCISTATFYVLINASLSGFFHSAKELRQGALSLCDSNGGIFSPDK